ncbi:hypothetical protein [Spiroplasma endosymbiont of Atherix ibis]|uniref:hypothetical protein n=1 Tax=Spiroplasma endosymbiont of Atherix ibis TaxID=3066291 RepID=UPI0030CC063B
MNKWNKELFVLKNNYLKNLKLTEQQNNLVQESVEYISADSIGNIKLKGTTIVIGSGDNKYVHELSDFNLSVTYNISSKVEEKIDFLSEFTSKVLIKGMHNFYGMDSSFKYPEFNSDENYLMNIGNKKIIPNILENLAKPYSYPGSISRIFWSLWSHLSDQNIK